MCIKKNLRWNVTILDQMLQFWIKCYRGIWSKFDLAHWRYGHIEIWPILAQCLEKVVGPLVKRPYLFLHLNEPLAWHYIVCFDFKLYIFNVVKNPKNFKLTEYFKNILNNGILILSEANGNF